eukprot:1161608-Pelagomonas_calceolata.AAC.4
MTQLQPSSLPSSSLPCLLPPLACYRSRCAPSVPCACPAFYCSSHDHYITTCLPTSLMLITPAALPPPYPVPAPASYCGSHHLTIISSHPSLACYCSWCAPSQPSSLQHLHHHLHCHHYYHDLPAIAPAALPPSPVPVPVPTSTAAPAAAPAPTRC